MTAIKHLISAALAGACAMAAMPSQAKSAVENPPVAIDGPDKPEEKLECRRDAVTGSRLSGRRVCKTRAQWKAEAESTRDEMGDLQRGSRNEQRAPR